MIPVLYIHLGVLPNYLKHSLNQSLKFNNKVVLITDVDVSIAGIEVVNSSLYDEYLENFEDVYIHMSTNNADFEKICIKRWIILANYVFINNIDVCFYSDSDVMLYANINDVYPKYQNYDAVYTLPDYQNNYRWTASACCSFWKKETLLKFSKFIINIYTSSELIKLKEKWNYHKINNLPGGVCDMTLLYLFSNTISFFSLTKMLEGTVFDQNYTDSENYYKDEYELIYDKDFKKYVKKIEWRDSLPYANNLIDNKVVNFIALVEYARYDCIQNKIDFKTKLYRILKRVVSKFQSIFKKNNPHGWFGKYNSWEEVEAECSGYDNNEILKTVRNSILKVRNGEAVYERDSVLFDKVQYSTDLINVFKQSIQNNTLSVVDFGGSLGSTYFQHKTIFQNIVLNWAIVEQKHFVDCGKKDIATDNLKFYYTISEALDEQDKHVLLASSVVQYFKEPYKLIDKLLSYNFEYIIIDRTAFIDGEEERITKQIVPDFIYKASYPSWFLNENKFVNVFLEKYDLLKTFPSAFDSDGILEDGKRVYRKGFYFRKK